MNRFKSIDITRGLVMVIMALDHVREFMHRTSMSQNPTDLQTTTTAIFFTRWVTHLCAPAFVFLSGVSAYISFRRKGNLSESRRFLLTRGIWLLLLEFTLVSFALWFDIRFRLELFEVIAAIGSGFILLSLLLKMNSRVVGLIGLLLIFSHNLLQSVPVPSGHISSFLFSVLFRPNLIRVSPQFAFYSAYPAIPWIGIMLAGFACGELFMLPEEKRRKVFLRMGLSAIGLFIVLRFINSYGDPSGWALQKSPLFTFLSFINLTKYPPSLMFSLLFTGLTAVLISVFERRQNRITAILEVYGRVPLFYFVIHLYIIHALMFVMLFIQGYGTSDFVFGPFKNGRPDRGGGVGLALTYVIWISVVAVLYPVCKWYGDYKARHPQGFVRYL